jgi:excisionase family DNA binding protein
MEKQYYRPDELAQMIEQPLWLVRRWLREDKIKHFHFGKRTRIPKEEIDKIISAGIVRN